VVTEDQGKEVAAAVEHPSFCEPSECLVGSTEVAFQRHRSAPRGVILPDDLLRTRFVTRVTEAVLEPGVRYLEVDVYPGDEQEPTAELRFTTGDLFMMIDFFFGLMHIGQPMEVDTAEFTVREMA
jgi:hypothetical protein